MLKDTWTERLSEYIDGTLGESERSALEAHVAECAACRGTLAELRQVVTQARTLEDRPPAQDLWPGIRDRVGARSAPGRTPGRGPGVSPPGRRLSFTVPQLAAASVALVILSAGAALRLRPGGAPAPGAGTAVAVQAGSWVRYDAAVAQLEEALAQNRDRLDTATVRVLQQSLATIDRAIAEAQRALAADPRDPYLNLHLAQTLRRKLELLRRANAIASAQT